MWNPTDSEFSELQREYEVIRLRELENKARIEASPEYREMKIRQQEQVWVDWDFEYKYGFSPNQDCDYD
jgi:hypothetical protein